MADRLGELSTDASADPLNGVIDRIRALLRMEKFEEHEALNGA